MTILLVALGGALGSVLRYLTADVVQRATHATFPAGTLVVNVAGSLIVGALTGYLMNMQAHPLLRPALIVGFCGGFTTFSAFSMETVGLITGGEIAKASAYAAGSLVLCVAAAAIGFSISGSLSR